MDVDILDEAILPAVSYPQPGGTDWHQLASLLRPALAGPGLVGLSVADLVPPLDPDGTHAGHLACLLHDLLAT